MGYGAIYIAHNPRDGENTFKVGKTERIVDERMKELSSSTSNLGTYSAKAYFIVTDIDEAERKCHQRLTQYRVQKNREFFKASAFFWQVSHWFDLDDLEMPRLCLLPLALGEAYRTFGLDLGPLFL